MPEAEKKETLYTAILKGVRNGLIETRTSFPAVIDTFDSETQTASVQPLIKATVRNGDVVSLPVLVDVPILFPRAGGFSVTFPVKAGDELLVTCCDRDFSVWMQQGGQQKPDSTEIHTLSSAVGVLGLYNQMNVLSDFSTSGMVLRSDDDATKITIENGKITVDAAQLEVNAPTTTLNATAFTVNAAATTWVGDIDHTGTHTNAGAIISNGKQLDTHLHSGVTAGAANTGAPV